MRVKLKAGLNMSDPYKTMADLYQEGFRQKSDATCGPSSVILAALSLGLELKQESEWQNNAFKAWMPVEKFSERGLALHELQFISEMIYAMQLNIQLRRAYSENNSLFLADLKHCFHYKNAVMVVNFRQNDFLEIFPDEDKNPHYSPIIAWDEKKQRIKIADVDPVIHEPYWVETEQMFCSMNHLIPAFHLPRGWLMVYKR